MRRRGLLLALGAVIPIGLVVAMLVKPWQREPEAPFTDLASVLDGYTGWTVLQQPKRPGPYRLLLYAGNPTRIDGHDDEHLTYRWRDEGGNITETVKLAPAPGYDRLVVLLETAEGPVTFLVLRRE